MRAFGFRVEFLGPQILRFFPGERKTQEVGPGKEGVGCWVLSSRHLQLAKDGTTKKGTQVF